MGRYFWECSACKSRFFTEPNTVDLRNGRLVKVSICTKCLKNCSCGQLKDGEEYCSVCGDGRKRITLRRYALSPDDPNFGVTSTGSTSYPTSTTGQTVDHHASYCVNWPAAGTTYASKWTFSNGTIQSITFYSYLAGAHIKVGIYTDSSGAPSSLVANSQLTVNSSSGGWVTATYSTPLYLVAGNYWIAANTDTDGNRIACTGAFSLDGTTSNTKFHAVSGGYTNALEASFGTTTTGSYQLEAYITYVQVEGYTKGTQVQYIGSKNGKVQQFQFYTHTGAAGDHFILAFYDDSGGNPNHRLWYSGSTGSANTTWNIIHATTGTYDNSWNGKLTPTAYYWFMWQWDNVDSGPSYAAGGANTGIYLAQTFGTLLSIWSGGTLSIENWSEYADYVIIRNFPAAGLSNFF